MNFFLKIEYDFAVQFPQHKTINGQDIKIIRDCIVRKLEQERKKASTEIQVYIQTLLSNVLNEGIVLLFLNVFLICALNN